MNRIFPGLFFSLIALLMTALAGCGASTVSAPPSGAVAASAGEYLLSLQLTGTDIYASTINESTGLLSSLVVTGAKTCNNTVYSVLAATPSGKFVYTIDTCFNSILLYVSNGPGLELTHSATTAVDNSITGGLLNNISVDPAGKYLYALLSNGIIMQYSIDPNSGGLTATTKITESNADFSRVTFDPAGKFIYLNDDISGIRVYSVGVGGSLAPALGSPLAIPNGGQAVTVLTGGNGKFLYAPLYLGGIEAYSIGPTGSLTMLPGSPVPTNFLPGFSAMAQSGKFLYLGTGQNASIRYIQGFIVDPSTGALSQMTDSPFVLPEPISSIVVDPSGTFLYTSSYGATGAANGSTTGYRIDPVSGNLTEVAGSPFVSTPSPENLLSVAVP